MPANERMRRILLDENVPVGVRDQLPEFSLSTVAEMGWAGLSNGELVSAAERVGFDLMITGDQNIAHQIDITASVLALVVLGTTHWPTIRANPQAVRRAVQRATRGAYVVANYPRPKAPRRPPPA